MIWIQSPLKREFIKELLDGNTFEEVQFNFIKQDQMKLYFEHTKEAKLASEVAKRAVKNSKYGSALFFAVNYE